MTTHWQVAVTSVGQVVGPAETSGVEPLVKQVVAMCRKVDHVLHVTVEVAAGAVSKAQLTFCPLTQPITIFNSCCYYSRMVTCG